MKKIFTMLLAIGMMAGIVNGQSAYLRLGVGGGIGLKQYNGTMWADVSGTTGTTNVEIKSMGLGGGFNANLAFGYMLSNNVGIELGVNEFLGMKKKTHIATTYSNSSYTEDLKISGMMLQIVPAIVFTPGLEKVNPYARLGMIVGILPSVVMTDAWTTTSGGGTLKATSSSESRARNTGGVAMGFTAAGGVAFDLSEKLSFFGELVFNVITYAPSKGKYTKYTTDGVDELATMKTKEKEWTFEKKYDALENIPDGNPDKQPKESILFSNVELNVGIKLKL